MKITLAYPKIPDETNCPLKQCIAFEKLDGTNLHWTWNSIDGWVSFGTRRDQFAFTDDGINEFNQAHTNLQGAPWLFKWEISPGLDDMFHAVQAKKVVLFTEWWGKKSFAGQHERADTMFLTPFDVEIDGKMLPPISFINMFVNYVIPKVVYRGKYTGQLIEDIRNGKYAVNEGVVIKGMVKDQVYMTKVKTKAYMEKLKIQFKDNWKDYWE